MRGFLRYNWRPVAATVILVVVGIMAISIMVQRPSFELAYVGDEVYCPSMISAPSGDAYNIYWYGQNSAVLSNEQIDQYVERSGLSRYTGDALDRVNQRIDTNWALLCSDLKANQQGRLVATLGIGVLLLAFLAVPGRRHPLRGGP